MCSYSRPRRRARIVASRNARRFQQTANVSRQYKGEKQTHNFATSQLSMRLCLGGRRARKGHHPQFWSLIQLAKLSN